MNRPLCEWFFEVRMWKTVQFKVFFFNLEVWKCFNSFFFVFYRRKWSSDCKICRRTDLFRIRFFLIKKKWIFVIKDVLEILSTGFGKDTPALHPLHRHIRIFLFFLILLLLFFFSLTIKLVDGVRKFKMLSLVPRIPRCKFCVISLDYPGWMRSVRKCVGLKQFGAAANC